VGFASRRCQSRRVLRAQRARTATSCAGCNYETASGRSFYSSYGTESHTTGNSDTPFRFHGTLGCMTDDNGLVYMRNRTYNPRTMRFLQADPIGFDGGMNFYSFADNNPIGIVDPWGLAAYSPDDPKTWVMPSGRQGYWTGTPGNSRFVFFQREIASTWFPKGVPFIKGMADFSSAQINPIVDGKSLIGSVKVQIKGTSIDQYNATKQFAQENKISMAKAKELLSELTWHHNADGRMILVRKVVNQGIQHTGYAAFARWSLKGGGKLLRGLGWLGAILSFHEEGPAAFLPMPTTTFGDDTVTTWNENGWAGRYYDDRSLEDRIKYLRFLLQEAKEGRFYYAESVREELRGIGGKEF